MLYQHKRMQLKAYHEHSVASCLRYRCLSPLRKRSALGPVLPAVQGLCQPRPELPALLRRHPPPDPCSCHQAVAQACGSNGQHGAVVCRPLCRSAPRHKHLQQMFPGSFHQH